jgi:phenylpropionate dioxygenase-like ring-hydroxylating dioxygenase large terminal subunit
MTPQSICPGWYPVRRLRDIGPAPQTLAFAGIRLVAQREPDGGIRVTSDADGSSWPSTDSGGFLHAAIGPAAGAFGARPPLLAGACANWMSDGEVEAGVADIAENILDTTHTSVVHAGYLRRASGLQRVDARISTGPDWVSADYPAAAAPGGWAARLIGADAHEIRDCFRAPGTAEVTYLDARGPAFAARFQLTPRSACRTYVAASFSVRGEGICAALKRTVMRLFFRRLFAEDRAILELITQNRTMHGSAPLIYAPSDFLRPGIDAILAGRAPLPQPSPIAIRI